MNPFSLEIQHPKQDNEKLIPKTFFSGQHNVIKKILQAATEKELSELIFIFPNRISCQEQ
jgi:hypothetical protein